MSDVGDDARTDRVLARRAANGDRAAFTDIVHRYGPGLFRYAVRMLDGDAGDAEDAVQESLISAWVHLVDFRGEASLKTWLYRIAANQVMSMRRRHRPVAVDHSLLSPTTGGTSGNPEDLRVNNELWAALDLALSELPWRQRASWLLREMEGLSYEEIARVLDTSTTVVRGQLHRARATLTVRLGQWR